MLSKPDDFLLLIELEIEHYSLALVNLELFSILVDKKTSLNSNLVFAKIL